MKIGQRWIDPNRAFAIFATLVFAYLYYVSQTADWAYVVTRDGITVGFLPRVITAAATILAAIGVVVPPKIYPPKLKELTVQGFIISVVFFVGCLVYYYYLFSYFGYLIPSIIFLGLGMFYLGMKPWYRAALNSTIAGVAIYIIFYGIGFEFDLFEFPF